jgi:hypothetical protein
MVPMDPTPEGMDDDLRLFMEILPGRDHAGIGVTGDASPALAPPTGAIRGVRLQVTFWPDPAW